VFSENGPAIQLERLIGKERLYCQTIHLDPIPGFFITRLSRLDRPRRKVEVVHNSATDSSTSDVAVERSRRSPKINVCIPMSIDIATMQNQDLVEVNCADGTGREAKELKD
jgi:hypothetical protein